MLQTARSLPTSPILNGTDALADLTRNLDDQLRMDALKQQRGPSPFQVLLHLLVTPFVLQQREKASITQELISILLHWVTHSLVIAKAARYPGPGFLDLSFT